MEIQFGQFNPNVLNATHIFRKAPGSERYKKMGFHNRFQASGTWGEYKRSVKTAMKHIKSGGYTIDQGHNTYYYKIPKPNLIR